MSKFIPIAIAAKEALVNSKKKNPNLQANDKIIIPNVLIFETGTYNDITTTEANLQSLVESFYKLKEDCNFTAFIKVTHKKKSEHGKDPGLIHPYVMGDVMNLRKDGKQLGADLETYVGLAEEFISGKLRSLSAEILHDLKDPVTGEVYSRALNAVAFLGSEREALWAVLNKYSIESNSDQIKEFDCELIIYELKEECQMATNELKEKEADTADKAKVSSLEKSLATMKKFMMKFAKKTGKTYSTESCDMDYDAAMEDLNKMKYELDTPDEDETNDMPQGKYKKKEDNAMKTDDLTVLESSLKADYQAKLDVQQKTIDDLQAQNRVIQAQSELSSTKEFVYSYVNNVEGMLIPAAIADALVTELTMLSVTKQANYSVAGSTDARSQKDIGRNIIDKMVEAYKPIMAAYNLAEKMPQVRGTDAISLAANPDADPESLIKDGQIKNYCLQNKLDHKNPDDYIAAMSILNLSF